MNTGVTFAGPIVLERAPRLRCTFHGSLQKPNRILNMHQNRLAPPGQPLTGSLQKMARATSSRQPLTRFFQNIRPHPLARSLPAEVRGLHTAARPGCIEIPSTGLEAGAPAQKLFPGPSVFFLNSGVIICSTYYVFERAARPQRTFPGPLYKMQTSRGASEILRSTKRPLYGADLF